MVRQLYNGKEAVDAVRQSMLKDQEPIHFVLMDNFMPILNGPDACKLMRDIGYKAPIFGLTGHALTEDLKHYLALGASEVFSKPIDLHKFVDALQKYVSCTTTAYVRKPSDLSIVSLE